MSAPDPVAKQLANLLAETGQTLSEHAAEIKQEKLEKHGVMVAYLKENYGLGHGNANLLTAKIRELHAGGPVSDAELLAAQYGGPKAALLPIYTELASICENMGDDVTVVIQKTAVAFRRNKLFAVVIAASAKRIQLGLNLPQTPAGDRVIAKKSMCSHQLNITQPDAIDDQLVGWIRASYTNC